jgi:hypothetical protein
MTMTGRILLLGLSVLCAGTAFAQSIPLPFSSDIEAARIGVIVTPDRRSMRGLSPSLVAARKQMHAHQPVSDANLIKLAEAGDGLAAQIYVRRLIASGAADRAPSDVAYYSAIAVETGRVWTLPDMIEAMKRLDPNTESRPRLRKYIQVLYPYAWTGNSLALDAVVEFNGTGRLFGELSDSTRDRILEQSQRNGDRMVELRMAMVLLEQGNLTKTQQNQARALLKRAQASSHLGVMTAAQNLMGLLEKNYAANR